MNMTKEDKELVIKYYIEMRRAKEHSYIMSCPMADVRRLYDIYKADQKQDNWTANLNCGSCLVTLFKKLYVAYYDKIVIDKEISEVLPQMGIEPKTQVINPKRVTKVVEKGVSNNGQKSPKNIVSKKVTGKNNNKKTNTK